MIEIKRPKMKNSEVSFIISRIIELRVLFRADLTTQLKGYKIEILATFYMSEEFKRFMENWLIFALNLRSTFHKQSLSWEELLLTLPWYYNQVKLLSFLSRLKYKFNREGI